MRLTRLAVSLSSCAFAIGAAVAPPAANAETSLGGCAAQTITRPFLPWADPSGYTLAPGGSFEAGAPAWTLSGGAGVSAGNESFFVGSPSDGSSLALPNGSRALSREVCVDIAHPTVRLFARNAGDATGTLQVSAVWRDALGSVVTVPMGSVVSGASWAPTAPLAIPVSLLPLTPGQTTSVALSFRATGGDWEIDDVYVDPYGRS